MANIITTITILPLLTVILINTTTNIITIAILIIGKVLRQRDKLVGCLREVLWKETERLLWEERRIHTLEGLCGRRGRRRLS